MDGDTVIGSNNCISNASNGSSNFIVIFESLPATPPLQLNQSLEWISMCAESSCCQREPFLWDRGLLFRSPGCVLCCEVYVSVPH